MKSIPITVKRHKCPTCSKSWASKRTADEHTEICWHNPDSRACRTCAHVDYDHFRFQLCDRDFEPDEGPPCNCLQKRGEPCERLCPAGINAFEMVTNCEKWENPDAGA